MRIAKKEGGRNAHGRCSTSSPLTFAAICAGLVALSMVVHGRFAFRFFPCEGWDIDWPVGPDDFIQLLGPCGYPVDARNFLHAFSPNNHVGHFYYIPVLHLLYLGQNLAFDFRPFGYHLVSAFLHGVTACTLYALGNQLLSKPLLWYVASALFVINPASDQAIYWIACQHVVTAAAFVLLSILFFLKWRKTGATQMAMLWFAASIMAFASKPDALILLFVLPLANFLLVQKENRVSMRDMKWIVCFGVVTCANLCLNWLAYHDQARLGYTGVTEYLKEPVEKRISAWAYIMIAGFAQIGILNVASVMRDTDINTIVPSVVIALTTIAFSVWLWRNKDKHLLFALLFCVIAAALPAAAVGTYAIRMSRFWYLPVVSQILLATLGLSRIASARLGAVGWVALFAILTVIIKKHVPLVLVPLIPIEGILLGPLYVVFVGLMERKQNPKSLLDAATTTPGILGTLLFVRAACLIIGSSNVLPQSITSLVIPLTVGILIMSFRREPVANQLLVAASVVLFHLVCELPLPTATQQLPLDCTLPLLAGLACWAMVEKIQWRIVRPSAVLFGMSVVIAVSFIAKADRIGRAWVASGEKGKLHVRSVFSHFKIPESRLKLLRGWNE